MYYLVDSPCPNGGDYNRLTLECCGTNEDPNFSDCAVSDQDNDGVEDNCDPYDNIGDAQNFDLSAADWAACDHANAGEDPGTDYPTCDPANDPYQCAGAPVADACPNPGDPFNCEVPPPLHVTDPGDSTPPTYCPSGYTYNAEFSVCQQAAADGDPSCPRGYSLDEGGLCTVATPPPPSDGGGATGNIGEDAVNLDLDFSGIEARLDVANEHLDNLNNKLEEGTYTDGDISYTADVASIDDALTSFNTRVQASALVTAFSGVSGAVGTGVGTCPDFSIDLSSTVIGRTVSTAIHCSVMTTHGGIISAVMLVVWGLIGFRILASA